MWIGMFRNIIRRLDLFVYGWQRMDLLLLTPFLQTFPLLQYFHVHVSIVKQFSSIILCSNETDANENLPPISSTFVNTYVDWYWL